LLSLSGPPPVTALPLIYLLAAATAGLPGRAGPRWRMAETGAGIAALCALSAGTLAIWRSMGGDVRVDSLGCLMGCLVGILGWVIVRYSARYLEGEPRQRVYLAALMSTLAAISVVVLTGNLAVLVAAWSCSSLSLHFLLTFYNDRAPALVAAHKKFLASRLAEVCLVGALLLLYRDQHTLSLGLLSQRVAADGLGAAGQGAMVLVAAAVLLKSAQLPVHGWLIQVMEAPTPVSALLHAGVVNLGGFVLLRLAVAFLHAPFARGLVLAVAGVTAIGASLILMTRNSIKVRLAWSTCAQMGFMLLECALGLYDLALLHLLAHSFYKAHAFLGAGDAVRAARRRMLLPPADSAAEPLKFGGRVAAGPVAGGLAWLVALLWQRLVPGFSVPDLPVLIVGFGVAPLLWPVAVAPWRRAVAGTAQALLLVCCYLAWHLVFSRFFGPLRGPGPAVSAAVAAGFAALYVMQTWFLSLPRSRVGRALYPWAHAGFFLDEFFTRLVFRVWPLRAPAVVHPMRRRGPLFASSGEQP